MDLRSITIPNSIFSQNLTNAMEQRRPLELPSPIVIPPLDTSSLVQYSGADVLTPPRQQRRRQPQTPLVNTRIHADRYNTPCSVERIVHDVVSHVYWFYDFQMAWIWIEGRIRDTPQNDWNLVPFQEAASSIETRWENGIEGKLIASCDEIRYKVFFEPGQEDEVHQFERRVQARRQAQAQQEDLPEISIAELEQRLLVSLRQALNNP